MAADHNTPFVDPRESPVDQAHAGRGTPEGRDLPFELFGQPLIVVVEEGHELPARRSQPEVSGRGNRERGVPDVADARIRPPADHGRGLLILDAMADEWGCHPTADGKVVWATIGVG